MTDTGVLKELRKQTAILQAFAEKLGVEPKAKPKPWTKGSVAVAVTKNYLTRTITGEDAAVPSALTPEMRKAAEAQTVEPSNPKSIETFEPEKPAYVLTELQEKAFESWR